MATAEKRDWIADYQVICPLGTPTPSTRTFVAVAPGRLTGGSRLVALFLIDAHPERFDKAVEHLQAMAAARSARMVPLIEAGRDDADEPVAYYATEYRAEGSLASQPPASVADRLRALAGAARGVHDLHQAGRVHGDLGPGSVLLGRGGAMVSVPRPPAPLEVGETVMANPPQQMETIDPAVIRGEGKSRATDLWALGATIHLVLAGRSLHPGLSGDDPLTAVQRVLFEPPLIDARLPAPQVAVIARCLQPNPDDRPSSAEHLAASLEAVAVAQ